MPLMKNVNFFMMMHFNHILGYNYGLFYGEYPFPIMILILIAELFFFGFFPELDF